MERLTVTPETPADPTDKDPAGVEIDENGRAVVDPDKRQAAKNEETPPERPEWLPEKFKTEADFVEAYKELEKKQGESTPQKDETPAADNVTPALTGDENVNEIVAKAGLDGEAIGREWNENGRLSDQSYEALKKIGFSQPVVDAVIRDRLSAQSARDATLTELGGGEENVKAVFEWARHNLPAAEIASYDAMFGGNDVVSAKLGMQALVREYEQKNPDAPRRISGDTVNRSGSSDAKPFASRAEMTKAIGDPRYAKDPAYRNAVQKRIHVSPF